MAQRLKADVRDRILAAAATTFAASGYTRATVAEIAEQADVTASNIYKYFENKQVLFDAVVSPSHAGRLMRLLRTRMRELSSIGMWSSATAEGSEHAKALLSFWVEQRLPVLILLNGAQGTRYENVRARMTREMARQAEHFVHKHAPGEADPHFSMVLQQIFANTVTMIAAILERYESGADIQHAFALFWSYQLAGLEALIKGRTPLAHRAEPH
ncbi:TetR/AcrR family transcriptional regulator [Trinickia fusca]|uniref:TetR/AcrR family transcriptional regulator n=1 Tax=Trinickia fusca TaxID=2419777 RepID=A0A494XNM4_9BURK|nr:TetR/AcrR family transcriptional regulator [Trinickia fusca]RKP52250.1 TetR/AcrR family transcriptional regulator [Trinickia fusca]